MNNLEQLTLTEMAEFVTSHRHLSWSATGQESVYDLIARVLKAQKYGHLSKGQKEVVKGFLTKVTGMSRAQLTRLIRRWIDTRRIERQPGRRPSFTRRYTAADVAVLAEVDAAHQDLSGPAVRHLCQRGWMVYKDKNFERLSGISNSGSSSIEIDLPFQAHAALESIPAFRLTSGLENAPPAAPVGPRDTWECLNVGGNRRFRSANRSLTVAALFRRSRVLD